MFGGLNRLFVAALVAGAVLVAPSAALACNGNPSAVNVYKECLPNGGGGKSTGGGTSNSGGPSTGSASVPVSSQAQKALSKAPAKDRRVLSALVKSGPSRLQMDKSAPTSAAPSPSAIGSAFDLGSGPTALLVALAATAFLLLAGTTVRGVRQRRR
jgi:hypothetical protein